MYLEVGFALLAKTIAIIVYDRIDVITKRTNNRIVLNIRFFFLVVLNAIWICIPVIF